MMQMEKRTDYCGNITSQYLDQDVLLYGWVQRVRNLGQLIFIDLRDREGIVQVVVNHDSRSGTDGCRFFSGPGIRGRSQGAR